MAGSDIGATVAGFVAALVKHSAIEMREEFRLIGSIELLYIKFLFFFLTLNFEFEFELYYFGKQ